MSDTYEVSKCGDYDEADALMSLHDDSMSEIGCKATTARMLKALIPVLMTAMEEEEKRLGTAFVERKADLIFASLEVTRNLLNNMLINFLSPGVIAPQYPQLADTFAASMKKDGEEILRRVKSGELNDA